MALIPSFFLDCAVAIGKEDGAAERRWIASGFLYGHLFEEDKNDRKSYRVYLVTNRHVFEGLPKVYLRFNPMEGQVAREYGLNTVDDDGRPTWIAEENPDIDVAIVPINFRLLQEHGIKVHFFQSDQHVANIQRMNDLGITEGDFAYVLGFPMGIVGTRRSFVIVRSGTVARIRDMLARVSNEFLLDAFVFPGNSGGPVVLKPEVVAIQGTKAQGSAYLIGIVKAYVPYRDVAVSLQTKQPRVIFEENSGLAAVHPIDFVEALVVKHLANLEESK